MVFWLSSTITVLQTHVYMTLMLVNKQLKCNQPLSIFHQNNVLEWCHSGSNWLLGCNFAVARVSCVATPVQNTLATLRHPLLPSFSSANITRCVCESVCVCVCVCVSVWVSEWVMSEWVSDECECVCVCVCMVCVCVVCVCVCVFVVLCVVFVLCVCIYVCCVCVCVCFVCVCVLYVLCVGVCVLCVCVFCCVLCVFVCVLCCVCVLLCVVSFSLCCVFLCVCVCGVCVCVCVCVADLASFSRSLWAFLLRLLLQITPWSLQTLFKDLRCELFLLAFIHSLCESSNGSSAWNVFALDSAGV